MRQEDTVEHPDAVRVEHRAGVVRIVWDRAATGNAVRLCTNHVPLGPEAPVMKETAR